MVSGITDSIGFAGVIGHRDVVELLAREAAAPAHAYLFVGPASIGKATVARRFAAAVLCPDGADDCRRRVVAGTHPDLTLVEPDGRTSLTVEQARAAAARALLAPVEADRKVFLFEEAGLMTDGAANALLKTLEEPSDTTIFILVTESEHDLPDTVASRSRTVTFARVGDDDVVAALLRAGVDEAQATRAALAAGGRPGLALAIATRPEVAAYRAAWLGVPGRITERPGDAFRLAAELVAAVDPLLGAVAERQESEVPGGDDPSTRAVRERHERERRRAAAALHVTGLEILASWYRDAAAAQFGAPTRNRDVPGTDLVAVTPAAALAAADRVLATVESLEANQRADLALAALFSDLAAAD
jgi:DNA polymerase-3 subunit delta'